MKKLLIVTTATLLAVSPVVAQQNGTKGNLVEIFGKNRLEIVEEGSVVHKATHGYYLPNTAPGGYLFQTRDALTWEILDGTFVAPSEEQCSATNYGGHDRIESGAKVEWTAINANEKGIFNDRALRGAYFYHAYESEKEELLLLQAKGGMRTIINGMPHEGDYYDFGYTLIPFIAKKGKNEILLTAGRYGRYELKLIKPNQAVMLTNPDMTLPDLVQGETNEKWGAIRVMNASTQALKNATIECHLSTGEHTVYSTGDIMPMSARKLPFLVPATTSKDKTLEATVTLKGKNGKTISEKKISLRNVSPKDVHERTFVSKIDGSVQYYSVQPSQTEGENQALFLSLHGASVEARNQARAYKAKDWGYIVCPTNRRPFGFNWEDIGRVDAIEVLEEAESIFATDKTKTYLTGHSMGGHGTWQVGVTYPDRFAAIAPCASYPDILNYGMKDRDKREMNNETFAVIKRAANMGRTHSLKQNYTQQGIYVLHGDSDSVVPVELVRNMRKELGVYHPDMVYYEYPGGSHWYGNNSVDWAPIFDYFRWHSKKKDTEVRNIDFTTASPAVSAKNHWITILQQEKPIEFSNINANVEGDAIEIKTTNIEQFTLRMKQSPVADKQATLSIDETTMQVTADGDITLKKGNDKKWSIAKINNGEKSPKRGSGFKEVFRNRVVFVYATAGSKEDNAWYQNKARFDAETMLYRANGSVEVISDSEYLKGNFDGRNVVIYGNADNHRAWNKLISNSPILVTNKGIKVGNEKMISGDNLSCYFIYPKNGCNNTLVGVVAGTGIEGAKGIYPNDYLLANTGFPDVMIFKANLLRDGLKAMQLTGFFGNDWSIESGDFTQNSLW